MKPIGPIDTVGLFQELDDELNKLLISLAADDWQKQTIAGNWKVKDIAAHLLDGNMRGISMFRDRYYLPKPEHINSYQDLVNHLNEINVSWVNAMKRVSPEIITALLKTTGAEYVSIIQTLDPSAKAVFSVAWAGEDESLNWFHIAREYTEKWHHQQQIRLAVGQTSVLYSRKYYHPYLDTSMRALPFHYKRIQADEGTLLSFIVDSDVGERWCLYRSSGSWELVEQQDLNPDVLVTIKADIAWRIFTKGISAGDARNGVTISGNQKLGEHFLSMLAVIA